VAERGKRYSETIVLKVVSYDPLSRTYMVNSRNNEGPLFNDIQGEPAKWVSPIPVSGSGSGHFVYPLTGSDILCLWEYTIDSLGLKETQNIFVLGFPEMESADKPTDAASINALEGDEVRQHESGSVKLIKTSGYEKDYYGPHANETRIPSTSTKNSMWQNVNETLRGGIKRWQWNRDTDNVSYIKQITESFVSDNNTTHNDLPGEESGNLFPTEEGDVPNFKNTIVFKGGKLIEGADPDEIGNEQGANVVGEDAGASYLTISKQKKIHGSSETLPNQFVKSVWGRVTSGLRQAFRFKVWDKEGVSELDVLVNKGGVESVHGMDITHKQAAGDATITISEDTTTGVRIIVKSNGQPQADITVGYDGEVVVGGDQIHLGGEAGEEPVVLGDTLEDLLNDILSTIQTTTFPVLGGSTGFPANVAAYKLLAARVKNIKSETVSCQ